MSAQRGNYGGQDRQNHGQQQQQQTPQQHHPISAIDEDLELAQMRREYLQMQRLQKEQERRMLEYQRQLAEQQQQLNQKTNNNNEDAVYGEYLQMVRAQLASQVGGHSGDPPMQSSSLVPQQHHHQQQQPPTQLRHQNHGNIATAIMNDGLLPVNAGFDIPALRGDTGRGQIQQQHYQQRQPQNQQQPVNINNFDQYSQRVIQEAFNGQHFHSCDDDKTINTMSSFDAQSMGMSMSTLGGFDWNQSQMSMLTNSNYNMSGLMSTSSHKTSKSRRKGGASDKIPASKLERKLEKVNSAHRRQQEERARQRQNESESATADDRAARRSSAAGHGRHTMSSLNFDAIEEDELFNSSNFKLSNMGLSNLSAMDMTFNESMMSLRGNSEVPVAEEDADHRDSVARGSTDKSRGKDIGRSSAGAEKQFTAQRLAGADKESRDKSSSTARKDKSAASHNFSMEDFGESFRSMDMEDRAAPPSRPPRQRPQRRSTIESMGVSDPDLFPENTSLGGSSWLNQHNSVENFGNGGGETGGAGGEEEDQASVGDISAPRMVMATGDNA